MKSLVKFTVIADTHHYSKTLGTSGKQYELRSGSDQKCLAETSEIIDSAFSQIAESDTDFVLIAGDVSNDGEMASHLEFREKLYELKKKKPVYVITATHDWCCDENPRRFDGDNVYHDVEVMKSSDLPEFYKDFGPKQSIDSFITKIGTICYTIELCDKVRVLCLNDDKNENDHAGFTPDCKEWIEKQVKKAHDDSCLIIGMEHHLLIPHISPLITGGSTCVANREEVASWFADMGLQYMFVGHSHIERTDSFISPNGNKITEVNVGSICGYPAPIVNVSVNEDFTLSYEVDHLKKINFDGKEVDAVDFLAKHATDMIHRIMECKSKADFEERLTALQVDGKKIAKLWFILHPIIKKLNVSISYDAYRLLRPFVISKADVMEYRYKPIMEFVDEILLSALDGSWKKYDKNSSYYQLVIAVVSIPYKLSKNKDAKELINAMENILTGGEIDSQKATI